MASCSKDDQLITLENEESGQDLIEMEIFKSGFKRIEKLEIPKNATILEIKNAKELESLLDATSKLPQGTLTAKAIKSKSFSSGLLKSQTENRTSKLSINDGDDGEFIGGGGTFGPGFATGPDNSGGIRRVYFIADYTYPWCNLEVEVAMSTKLGSQPTDPVNVTGHLVSVSATSGVGGYNLNSSTSSSQQTNSVIFNFSGELFCCFTYNNVYYGNSGTILCTGWANSDGAGQAFFEPIDTN